MKKSISILLTFVPLIIFGQVDSIIGTYVTYTMGNSPIIKILSDSTFSYQSPIDVGHVFETFGDLEFSGDTVYFNYKEKIHPEITNFSSRLNTDNKNITIKVEGNFNWYDNISLYVNEPFSENGKIVTFDSNRVASLDSIKDSDNTFIHISMYSLIPISLNLKKYNEFRFQIFLPTNQTIYCLVEEKALLKNGLLYFSMTEEGIPYYNTEVYLKKKEIRQIRELIWEKRMEEINKDSR